MRISIEIFIRRVPILYRHRIIALIKEALNTSSKSYKEVLYPSTKNRKKPKAFCFGLQLPSPRNLKDEIFSYPKETRANLIISTSDYEFLINIYNGLLKIKEFSLDEGIDFRIGRCFLLPKKEIYENEVVFRTLSPILLEDKRENPIIPDKKGKVINKEFFEIHNRILKSLRGKGLKEEIEFSPVKIRKQVVKHRIDEFVKKTNKPYMTLTCFEGIFKLKGDKEDLQFLYDNGVGLRTSQGFGLVEIVG